VPLEISKSGAYTSYTRYRGADDGWRQTEFTGDEDLVLESVDLRLPMPEIYAELGRRQAGLAIARIAQDILCLAVRLSAWMGGGVPACRHVENASRRSTTQCKLL